MQHSVLVLLVFGNLLVYSDRLWLRLVLVQRHPRLVLVCLVSLRRQRPVLLLRTWPVSSSTKKRYFLWSLVRVVCNTTSVAADDVPDSIPSFDVVQDAISRELSVALWCECFWILFFKGADFFTVDRFLIFTFSTDGLHSDYQLQVIAVLDTALHYTYALAWNVSNSLQLQSARS